MAGLQLLGRARKSLIKEQSAWETEEVGDDEEDNQPLDSWVDLHEGLTEEEVAELDASIQPMQLMLSKLQKMVFALKNSTTILLPWWYTTLAAHNLPQHMMCNAQAMRWNSMFDMLEFALKCHQAINTMAATQDFNLHKYELA
ncbi:hypothetical protein EI94DRAFT_1569615 [Lactarius quietus]|nr:hypothetical protein EI94DRAFT_1569615 [Lactarius quietus]